MSGKIVIYKRVSTLEQHTDRQTFEGIQADKTFEDKASGKSTDRPALKELLSYLREGDNLYVYSIDRLARNLQDLLNLLEQLMAKGVTLTFQKERLTFKPGKDDPFQSLQLSIIGAVAAFERSIILSRQQEGMAAAVKRGVRFGRPSKLSTSQKQELREKVEQGFSKEFIAQALGISRQTVYAILREGKDAAAGLQEASNG